MDYYQEIISLIADGHIKDQNDLQRAKARLCSRYGMKSMPTNADILAHADESVYDAVLPLLQLKPSRTASGVAVVAVMTSPFPCPHGKCSYCPGGVENNSAQSYTGREPAALRAAQHNFDPYRQTRARIEQLQEIGHPTDKVDLIIMGGTFTARDRSYQESFIKGCLDAMNGSVSPTLEEAQRINETARSRCIGLTVETRPDYFYQEQIDFSMHLGATRVELGVQILDDDILAGVKRGHGIAEVVKSTELTKKAGLKAVYHFMPGLPGATPERDYESFRLAFSDERFMPDMLKIYPTLVVKGTELYEMWKRGEYTPYSLEETIDLLARVKSEIIPPWVRIQRIQRDIPAPLIEAGVKKSNLRNLVQDRLKEEGKKCRCIRCREIGRADSVDIRDINPETSELLIREYRASGGLERFISYEVSDRIIAFLRLRLDDNATVRELKVFGSLVPISEHNSRGVQHRGFGERLLAKAEEMSADMGYDRIRVTSGIGVRGYYRMNGYSLEAPYMVKNLGGGA